MSEKGEIVEKMSNFSRKAGRVVFSELFWGALKPLDRFWTTFWSLWAKSPKGDPKAPKGVPGVTKKGAFFEQVARKGPKKRSLGYSLKRNPAD